MRACGGYIYEPMIFPICLMVGYLPWHVVENSTQLTAASHIQVCTNLSSPTEDSALFALSILLYRCDWHAYYGSVGCQVFKRGGHCVLNGVLRGHFLGCSSEIKV